MTTSPHVELLAPGLGLGAAAVDGRAGSIEDMIASGLMSYRMLVINYVKTKLAEEAEVTSFRILELLNEASALFLGRFNGIVGPAAATAYVRAYQAANAGDVPIATIYALADEHTKRIARYYDETSREALVGGFNTFVNRQIPAKVAADRAMDAYGLTPRQMSGYTSLETKMKMESARPRSLKRKALEYIGTSIRYRVKTFAKQEAHNLDLQAKQTAWLWMQDKGALSANARKMWLTAKDEKTCKICGPMHGKKIGVADRFELPNGIKVWVPGPHPNCRCEIRVIDLIAKADDKWYNDEYTRTSDGRFARKRGLVTPVQPETIERERGSIIPLETPDIIPTEVAEEVPEKLDVTPTAKLDVRPSKLTVGPKKLDVAPSKLDIIPGVKSTEKLEVTQRREKLDISLPPLKKLEVQAGIERALLDLKPRLPVEAKRRRTGFKPTIRIVDGHGTPHPVYAVFEPWELDRPHTHRDRFTAHRDKRWTSSESVVATDATDLLDQMVEDTIDEIKESGNKIEMRGADGEKYHAFISDEDVLDFVLTMAHGNYSGDPDWTGEATEVRVTWQTTEGGKPMFKTPDHVTYADLAREWGISQDQFQIYIMRLEEGHDSSLGRTWQADAETRHSEAVWATEGDYVFEMTSKTIPITGHAGRFKIYDAIPDVEIEYFGDNPDD